MDRTAAGGPRARAALALVAVTVVWGAAFPLLKISVGAYGPARTIFWRFAFAALCLLPWAWRELPAPASARAGGVLGALNLGVYALLAVGIDGLPAARVAFLLSLSVVFVPILGGLWTRAWPRRSAVIAALLSLAGVATMTVGGHVALGGRDVLVGAAAMIAALSVLVLARLDREGAPPWPTALYMMATTSVLALPWSLAVASPASPAPASAALALLASSVLATALAYALQVRFAPEVDPSTAALIYALKPVVAAACASWMAGEALGTRGWLGGAAIVVASVLPALGSRRTAAAAAGTACVAARPR